MSKRPPALLKSSVAVAVVLSISACSSMPSKPDFQMSHIGDGIKKVGKTTVDASRTMWGKTTYLLGFSDTLPGETNAESDDQLLAAVEIPEIQLPEQDDDVLPLADAQTLDGDVIQRPTVVQQATAISDDTLIDNDLAVADLTENEPELQMALTDTDALTDTAEQEDLVYEVAAKENLWDIAKATTGDATNWHTIADLNSLGQNAVVFPGQQLIIPGSLAKADAESPIERQSMTASLESSDEPGLIELPPLGDDSQELAVVALEPTTQDTPIQPNDALSASFEVGANETLWDLSKRTTGDATNWQAIASFNNFSEKQAVTVRPGQTILVPQELVSAEFDVVNESAAQLPADTAQEFEVTAELETATAPELIDAATDTATDAATSAVAAQTNELPAVASIADASQESQTVIAETLAQTSVLDETQDIKIVEATYKGDTSLEPLVSDTGASMEITHNANIPTEIKVSGTYYPKAIYNDADFSSSLLMRVSPGTTLQVADAIGSWFKVETEEGVGYVHQRDIQ